MLVYVLTSNYENTDTGDCDNKVIGVYKNVEDAIKRFEKEVEDVKKDFKDYDIEETRLGDMCYSIWEKDEYMSHYCHIEISLRRLE